MSCHAVTAAGEAGEDELPLVLRQRARHQGGGGGGGGGGAGPGLAHSQGHHTLPLQGLQSGQDSRDLFPLLRLQALINFAKIR